VALVAVSKSVSAARLGAALEAGMTTFGENRVQEAESKAPDVPGARWHLVGHLQGNKASRAMRLFESIDSVDSLDLAQRLSGLAHDQRDGRRLPILLQVNVDRDPSKEGFDPAALEEVLAELLALPGLDVQGLMTVGRMVDRPEDARPSFSSLRQLSERLRSAEPRLGPQLSMGMSDDFEVAVEEGATTVRVGRALFGERTGPTG
jgi:pyridoxal phosphate enzyme (YggS family)